MSSLCHPTRRRSGPTPERRCMTRLGAAVQMATVSSACADEGEGLAVLIFGPSLVAHDGRHGMFWWSTAPSATRATPTVARSMVRLSKLPLVLAPTAFARLPSN